MGACAKVAVSPRTIRPAVQPTCCPTWIRSVRGDNPVWGLWERWFHLTSSPVLMTLGVTWKRRIRVSKVTNPPMVYPSIIGTLSPCVTGRGNYR